VDQGFRQASGSEVVTGLQRTGRCVDGARILGSLHEASGNAKKLIGVYQRTFEKHVVGLRVDKAQDNMERSFTLRDGLRQRLVKHDSSCEQCIAAEGSQL
jgi:hypothetical protein